MKLLLLWEIVIVMINGNRTSCRPIRSVIILVINKSDSGEGTATRRLLRGRPILLNTHMITERIEFQSVLLPL